MNITPGLLFDTPFPYVVFGVGCGIFYGCRKVWHYIKHESLIAPQTTKNGAKVSKDTPAP